MEIVNIDVQIFSETNNVDTFTVLWYTVVHSVEYLRRYDIIACIVEVFKYGFECTTFVVDCETFHIFKEKGSWLMLAENGLYLKEKRTASFILKTKSSASKRERLTGETSA